LGSLVVSIAYFNVEGSIFEWVAVAGLQQCTMFMM